MNTSTALSKKLLQVWEELNPVYSNVTTTRSRKELKFEFYNIQCIISDFMYLDKSLRTEEYLKKLIQMELNSIKLKIATGEFVSTNQLSYTSYLQFLENLM